MRTPQVFCFPRYAESRKQLRAKTKVIVGLDNSLAGKLHQEATSYLIKAKVKQLFGLAHTGNKMFGITGCLTSQEIF